MLWVGGEGGVEGMVFHLVIYEKACPSIDGGIFALCWGERV